MEAYRFRAYGALATPVVRPTGFGRWELMTVDTAHRAQLVMPGVSLSAVLATRPGPNKRLEADARKAARQQEYVQRPNQPPGVGKNPAKE